MEIISKEKMNQLYEEEESSGREYIEWIGEREIDGLLYYINRDTRTGKEYATRQIRTVHMGFNENDPGTVERLTEIVEREGSCLASWGVTGRTMHSILAHQLEEQLPQYRFEIGYNYKCLVSKGA